MGFDKKSSKPSKACLFKFFSASLCSSPSSRVSGRILSRARHPDVGAEDPELKQTDRSLPPGGCVGSNRYFLNTSLWKIIAGSQPERGSAGRVVAPLHQSPIRAAFPELCLSLTVARLRRSAALLQDAIGNEQEFLQPVCHGKQPSLP